ncbi:hypothetical protein BCR33DRAFT_713845 [Rhizoclosmatium globosum]|uniref:Uncharacterized protein n=1 Tax=Rhizoclosmatium globosum TaxID=329046 RepID=A0A1Y2CR72_9FUNG|nr:hypothetical protein BCR33DRAFT_713845 [Rhizoclosmatium globosum]|eukprot:ORY49540.1 hypothetical protein BCR33DRAFT_713845 [Rhizoclosmatium globosum]
MSVKCSLVHSTSLPSEHPIALVEATCGASCAAEATRTGTIYTFASPRIENEGLKCFCFAGQEPTLGQQQSVSTDCIPCNNNRETCGLAQSEQSTVYAFIPIQNPLIKPTGTLQQNKIGLESATSPIHSLSSDNNTTSPSALTAPNILPTIIVPPPTSPNTTTITNTNTTNLQQQDQPSNTLSPTLIAAISICTTLALLTLLLTLFCFLRRGKTLKTSSTAEPMIPSNTTTTTTTTTNSVSRQMSQESHTSTLPRRGTVFWPFGVSEGAGVAVVAGSSGNRNGMWMSMDATTYGTVGRSDTTGRNVVDRGDEGVPIMSSSSSSSSSSEEYVALDGSASYLLDVEHQRGATVQIGDAVLVGRVPTTVTL